MNARHARLARKAGKEAAIHTLDAAAPAIEKLVDYANRINARVEGLERAEEPLRSSRLDYIGFKARGLRGRLAWVFLGR